MTDKEKLIALFNEWGVGFELEENANDEAFKRGCYDKILCREGRTKIDGYSMFLTVFEFDASGKFIQMGSWE